ncbi:MAG: hypothetical protein H7125_03275, partial [Proteobacteria bacterium]|nr:hypothetical protein [Burkholderiales bacterium]
MAPEPRVRAAPFTRPSITIMSMMKAIMGCTLACTTVVTPAFAQPYPRKPITLI